MSNVYSRLLLNEGGGVKNNVIRADLSPNAVNVIIGLGGTGITALRSVKTQVYQRLQPDMPEAMTKDYSHIVFLGVDSDNYASSGIKSRHHNIKNESECLLPLNNSEYFELSDPHVYKILSDFQVLSERRDLSWYNKRNSNPFLDLLTESYCGHGVRQIGRAHFMDKAQEFVNKVKAAICTAIANLNIPDINIHIISGLSGSTGSGCFLDVCYLIRRLLNDMSLSARIFGYFYLPDVNLDIIPLTQPNARECIIVNGYAAMKELDYCMSFPENGGSFKQYYNGIGDVDWNCPPVDFCHLICSTNERGDVIPNAYQFAISVVAEHIIGFLIYDDNKWFQYFYGDLFHIAKKINEEKDTGINYCYLSLGGTYAFTPYTDILTYLTTEIFAKFSEALKSNFPSEFDCKKLVAEALTGNSEMTTEYQMFNALWCEISKGASDDWVPFQGNGSIEPHYKNQLTIKKTIAETNCKELIQGNTDSLVKKFRTSLESVLKDIDRGPSFAYRMLAASISHNVFNILDGIIAINSDRWKQEVAQEDFEVTTCDMAHAEFMKRPSRRRFEEYEHWLKIRMQHDLAISNYQQMDDLLRKLKKQLETLVESYYLKLDRVMSTLIRTFDENKKTFASQETLLVKSVFAKPIITVSEISNILNNEIRKLNITDVFNTLVVAMMENEDSWIQEKEEKIASFISDFFVNHVFDSFAKKSVSELLIEKYNFNSLSEDFYKDLVDKLYSTEIEPMVSISEQFLFIFNPCIVNNDSLTKKIVLVIPHDKWCVDATNTFHTIISSEHNRISAFCVGGVFPIGSYEHSKEYDKCYQYHIRQVGLHLYEGNPIDGMVFSDWRNLPSLLPYSFGKPIDEIEQLYEKAIKYYVLDDKMNICSPSDKELKEYEELIKKCELLTTSNLCDERFNDYIRFADALSEYKINSMHPTGDCFINDGNFNNEICERIRKDHFYLEPVHRAKVKEIVDKLDYITTKAKKTENKLRQTIHFITNYSIDFDDYCMALFSGVFIVAGRNINYIQDDLGLETEHFLTKPSPEFPFSSIPMYQAYVTYRSLPDDMKRNIRARTDEIIDTDPGTLKNGIMAVSAMLERIRAFKRAADRFEQKDEIERFLTDLNNKFKNDFFPTYVNSIKK